jgi:acyl-coenzyme A synthetase/AMP-(fatty) acid ligase
MSLTNSSDPWSELGELPAKVNMARFLVERAAAAPDALAIRVAKTIAGETRFADTTFAELARTSGELATGLPWAGVARGARVSVFVRPGLELISIVFALLRIGAVPVLIDPGMGPKNVLSCIERMAPETFVGIPLAHVLRRAHPRAFRTVTLDVVTSGRGSRALARLTGARHIGDIQGDGVGKNAGLLDTDRGDEAAILFTSGSTGPPKGVVYTHGMFEAQVRALKSLYGIEPGEIDVACLPVFALFGPALGMTSVFPELDPSKPATCDPATLAAVIRAAGATTTFGSPAIWRRVVPYCLENGIGLPSLRRVLIAGAPVPTRLIADFHKLLAAGADVHTPFGATESLPVSSAAGRELVATGPDSIRTRSETGSGTCIGRLAPGIELRLIAVTDENLVSFEEATEIPITRGEPSPLGELVVRGPVVTREYKFEARGTAAAKIPVDIREAHDPSEVWHRIGDVGTVDAEGRLWFCGRKSHRLETARGMVMPVPIENVFNTSPKVARSALVGLGISGAEEEVLVVQPEAGINPSTALATELFDHVADQAITRHVTAILFHKSFPVDVRHNAKIHRGELKTWAAAQPASARFARPKKGAPV